MNDSINADITPVEDAMKPAGLSDREWRAVLDLRAREAEEARHIEAWRPILQELYDAEDGDDDELGNGPARLFDRMTGVCGWDEDIVEIFAKALMRARGFKQTKIKGHGECWER